jgi:hypothetical protein
MGAALLDEYRQDSGMGLNHTCVSEVGHVKVNKSRFATRFHRIANDNRSNSNCLDDVLQVFGSIDSKNASNLFGGIANKGL